MIVRSLQALTAVLAFGLVAACAAETSPPPPATSVSVAAPRVDFADLEAKYDARLGLYALDTGTGREIGFRADERFAYCSTIKVPLVGALLRRGDDLNEVLTYSGADVVDNSPYTKDRTSVTLREAVESALTQSDNTAANLMYRELGGPSALGAVLREIGDTTTHADRTETDLNTAVPGDIRDTTTPRAMAATLRTLVLGDALPADKRDLLAGIMRGNTTGNATIRAGVPSGWSVADKTGSGSYGTRNDIAVVWPPSGAPIVIAVLTSRATEDAGPQNPLLAEATARAVGALR
ncbi:class A beta-lactamase [Amycolatopsis thermophila]|uniref:Beta-lactamase n=1 Tax=Amycolatopsis thermophila TaxID=206084 RepID=A0ABU0F6A1_9PSEU|nr:class A beta-lactamase [Amycolatopsis thermophila]MDQ0383118.1 beta-lactamase class A [Amycolatopsis thermophila]